MNRETGDIRLKTAPPQNMKSRVRPKTPPGSVMRRIWASRQPIEYPNRSMRAPGSTSGCRPAAIACTSWRTS
jgi:hypothetical protein